MLFVIGNRNQVGACIPRAEKICELGVFKGDNAEFLIKTHSPSEIHLVDIWDAKSFVDSYNCFQPQPSFVAGIESFSHYFGGNPAEQKTWDEIYKIANDKFKGNKSVKIIKGETFKAAENYPDGYFDLIYIDANHMYPFVQRDLFSWKDKLHPDGFIILNDCSSFADGRKQNLGVLEAATNFIKATGFKPLATTCDAYSDLVLVKPNSKNSQTFISNIFSNNISVIEIPDELLFSYQHKLINVGGKQMYIPSFKV